MLPCVQKRAFVRQMVATTSIQHPPGVPAPNGTQSDIGTQSAYVNVNKLQCAFSGVGGLVTGQLVVPVKVRAKGGDTTVHTYAFLDGGSNTSFCSEQLMKRLGVKGINTTISLTTMERVSSTRKCELVQLEVFDLEEEIFIELPLVFLRLNFQWPQRVFPARKMLTGGPI